MTNAQPIFVRTSLALLLASTLTLVGCGGQETEAPVTEEPVATDTSMATSASASAVAVLQPTEGNNVQGTVRFTQVDGAVRVTADLTGLSEGQHGFHVHETGDCSAPDATSAGGHFAPEGSPHGAPDAPANQRHTGDLGNIEAGADGSATYERVDSLLAFEGQNSIIGKAVIVHATADDLSSQPSGNAGARVACGVIQAETTGQ